jgi:hypothetical protein
MASSAIATISIASQISFVMRAPWKLTPKAGAHLCVLWLYLCTPSMGMN